jgi:hypothetical protein
VIGSLFDWPPTDESIAIWASLVTVILFAFGAIRWGGRLVRWCFRRIERRFREAAPSDTFRVVQGTRRLDWNDGTVAGRPATQVNGVWLVTNVMTDTNLVVANVHLRLPLPMRWRMDRDLSEIDVRSAQVVDSGTASEIHGIFWLIPRLAKPGRELRATVVFTDQFENRRRVRARFRAPRPSPPVPERPRERISEIEDPIEKEIAGVLQAELARYRTNGRREGGLGSVTTTYGGRQQQGAGGNVGSQVGTPRNQVIVDDPQNASLESDNADSLLALFHSLDSDEERERFRSALLARVSRDSIYAPVAYLPLLVALELEFAPQFFRHARESLLGDTIYGFSNCLMLTNGLLRLRHPMFSDQLLDDIERFTHDTGEHPFQIPERIAAIRADRLRRRRGSKGRKQPADQSDLDDGGSVVSSSEPDEDG